MGHTHEHDKSSYYLEQLCLIAVGAALGGGGIYLWATNSLENLLVSLFQLMTMIGGVCLMAIVVVRAISLWQSAGAAEFDHHHDHDCGHDHDHGHVHDHTHLHGHDHDHEHAHDCGHDHTHESGSSEAPAEVHSHGHDHSWNPVRFVILLLPLVLLILGMPGKGFNKTYAEAKAREEARNQRYQMPTEAGLVSVQDKGGDLINLQFKELEDAAGNEGLRDFYEGKRGKIKGIFAPAADEHMCTLIRFKITCCTADAVPLKLVIVSPESLRSIPSAQWVNVSGQIQFRKRPGRDNYLPVLQLASAKDIELVDPDPNPFIQ
jgi:hypothetical protein